MFFRKWSRGRLLAWIAGALMLLGFGQAWSLIRSAKRQNVTVPVPDTTEQAEMLLTGTVIRQEQVVEGDPSISWECRKNSGDRVAPGEILFRESNLTMRRWAWDQQVNADAAQYRSQNLYRRREQLWRAIQTGTQQENAMELQALLLAESDPETAGQSALETVSLQTIIAPEDGVFALGADGLESLLTPEHPTLSVSLPLKDAPETAMGRLITSDTWYFAAVWCTAPEMGQTVQAELLGGGFGTCQLTVEQVEKQSGGYLVLCSCNQRVEAVTMVRQLCVKILSD